jgi:hypothetical protein
MRSFQFIVLAGLLAGTSGVQAAGVGIRAGTLGVGGDVGWRVAPTLSARLGYSRLNWDRDFSTEEVRYDGRLKLGNLSGMLDFSPLGPFRLTGGLVYNDNTFAMSARPSGGSFTISGRTYSASDVGNFSGEVQSGRRLAPYLGIGYGNVAGLGVNFYVDLGIIFHGSPRADLRAACGPALSAGACAQLQSDVAAEEARVERELRRFKYYPVLNIGLTVGF